MKGHIPAFSTQYLSDLVFCFLAGFFFLSEAKQSHLESAKCHRKTQTIVWLSYFFWSAGWSLSRRDQPADRVTSLVLNSLAQWPQTEGPISSTNSQPASAEDRRGIVVTGNTAVSHPHELWCCIASDPGHHVQPSWPASGGWSSGQAGELAQPTYARIAGTKSFCESSRP